MVFWILLPVFAAVGLYLIWYSRQRRKMLHTFASQNRLPVRPEAEASLQAILDRCFSLHQKGLVRSFAQLSCPIRGDAVWLFRTVELLDLNPRAQAESTHFSRLVALFEVPDELNAFVLLDRQLKFHPRVPAQQPLPEPVVQQIKQAVQSCQARHTLSLTLASGQCLIYFEPRVTGGESLQDLETLYRIACELQQTLPRAV